MSDPRTNIFDRLRAGEDCGPELVTLNHIAAAALTALESIISAVGNETAGRLIIDEFERRYNEMETNSQRGAAAPSDEPGPFDDPLDTDIDSNIVLGQE